MGKSPAEAEKDSGAAGFFAGWRAQLPGVAASLTTAFILWGVSVGVEPVRRYLYGSADIEYPIFCTADAVPGPNGGRRVELYVVNRSAEDLTAAGLQQQLDRALKGSGRGTATIFLKADPNLRIGSRGTDDSFNGDKGKLLVREAPGGVEVTIERITARSILRGVIDLPDQHADVTRNPRRAYVPFEIGDLLENCYTPK